MLSLDDKLLLITSRVFSLLEPNDQDDLVITFIIKPGLGEITCPYKMYSMPLPMVEDARYHTKDFRDEYDDSAGLKVREQTNCYVTKEDPQRGAMTTTCSGPLCGEKAGDVRPHGGEHPGEGLHHRHLPLQGDGQRGDSQYGLARTLPHLQGVIQASTLQDPKQEAIQEGCHDERSLTVAGTVLTLLKTIEGQTRHISLTWSIDICLQLLRQS